MPVRLKKIMSKCNVMMFAAGLGMRLRPATELNPKPALPLNQIPLGYYALPYLQNLQIEKFVVNTFHLPKKIHDLYNPIHKNILFSDESGFIKGSGGGLKQAEKYLNSNLPILTMNADEIFFTEENNFIQNAIAEHHTTNALATLIVTEHPEAGSKFGGIWCEPNSNKVIHIGKDRPNETAKAWHFIGLQILSPTVLKLIPENTETNIFYDVLIQYLKTETIQIYDIKCDWYEVGNIQDYKTAKSEINLKLSANAFYKNHFEKLNQFPQSKLGDLT